MGRYVGIIAPEMSNWPDGYPRAQKRDRFISRSYKYKSDEVESYLKIIARGYDYFLLLITVNCLKSTSIIRQVFKSQPRTSFDYEWIVTRKARKITQRIVVALRRGNRSTTPDPVRLKSLKFIIRVNPIDAVRRYSEIIAHFARFWQFQ